MGAATTGRHEVSAVFGIHGEADLAEVRRMGGRLARRGQQQAVWSVTPRVHLGTRAEVGAAAQPWGLPVAFTSFFDNRPELLELVGADGDRGGTGGSRTPSCSSPSTADMGWTVWG